jgi:hypothetical protein
VFQGNSNVLTSIEADGEVVSTKPFINVLEVEFDFSGQIQ